MPNIHIIAGCNGAGKTTASFTILPEDLKLREYVNADSIAAGLSPLRGKQYLPQIIIGRLSQDMNACEVIWDFYKLHHR